MKKKIIFIESLMKDGGGHHMDNLIETTLHFKYQNEIIWLLNKKFQKKNLFIPKEIILKNLVPEIKSNFFARIFIKTYIFFLSIIFFTKKKKIFDFFKIFSKNFFSIPDFFNLEIYNFFNNQKFLPHDTIVIQSCRPKDVELIFFLSELIERMPKVIMRVLYPPKKKMFKNFYYHTEKLIEKKYKIKIFTEVTTVKDYIKKRLNYEVKNFTQIYTFYNREFPKNFTIGFLGETRLDKGFARIPNLINILSKKNIDCKFIIQFSKNIYVDTENIKKQIIDISKTNHNIKIIDGYVDFWAYRNYLKEINIMPLLYDADKLNFVGSGIFYSCITNEIPMIIPSKAKLLNEYLNYESYEKANSDEEYANSVIKIINNYDFYLNECKKFSDSYKKDISTDPLVNDLKN